MKTISKINEKIFSLVSELNDLENQDHDFNTRGNKIVANIKVYDWIDNDDVLKICQDQNYSKKQTKKVCKEFNDDRLINVHNHVCEDLVSNLKDQYESNCDISNFTTIFKTWARANNTDWITKDFYLENYKKDNYYINKYWDESKKFASQKSWNQKIIRENKIEFLEFEKRNRIDKFEVWQFGRSGGWLSICDESEATCESLSDNYSSYIFDELNDAYNTGDNNQFNSVLGDYLDRETKNEFLKTLKSYLQDHKNKIEAITSIIDDIESSKKYFKENLLDQLNYEITEFASSEFSMQKTNVTIQINDNKIKTSLGVTVDENEFKNAFFAALPEINKLPVKAKLSIKKQVGNYFVEFAKRTKNDVIIKAGCHRFSLNNILEVLNAAPAA